MKYTQTHTETAAPEAPQHSPRLAMAARNAADWLCNWSKGSDPWKRGMELRGAVAEWEAGK